MFPLSPEQLNELTEAIAESVIAKMSERFFLVEKTYPLSVQRDVSEDLFVHNVIAQVCKYYKISDDYLKDSNGRVNDDLRVVHLRYIVMSLCRIIPKDRPIPLKRIAAHLKKKNHCVVLFGVRQCEELKEINSVFRHDYKELERIVRETALI